MADNDDSTSVEDLERVGRLLLDKVRCPKCHDVYEDPRVFQCVCIAWCLRCFKRHASVRPGSDANYAFIGCPVCHATTTWTHSINPSRPKSMISHPASAPLPPTDEPSSAAVIDMSSEAAAAAAVDNVSELFRDLDICRLIQDYKDLCVRLCTHAWTHHIQLAHHHPQHLDHHEQQHHQRTHDQSHQQHLQRQAPPPRPQSVAPSHPPLRQYEEEADHNNRSDNDSSASYEAEDNHQGYGQHYQTTNGEHSGHYYDDNHDGGNYNHDHDHDYDDRPPTPDLLSELDSILEDLDATSDMIAAREHNDADGDQNGHSSEQQPATEAAVAPVLLPRPTTTVGAPPTALPRPRPPPPLPTLGGGKALSTTSGKKIGNFLAMDTPDR